MFSVHVCSYPFHMYMKMIVNLFGLRHLQKKRNFAEKKEATTRKEREHVPRFSGREERCPGSEARGELLR